MIDASLEKQIKSLIILDDGDIIGYALNPEERHEVASGGSAIRPFLR